MITPIHITWNNSFKNDGLLYFVQRIIEMLDYESIDIFRAPLHNTSSLIDEYLRVNQSKIKKFHLEQVYEEFIYSLEHDIVIKFSLGEKKLEQILSKLKREPNNRQQLIEYLCHIVGKHYLTWSKDYIRFIITTPKEKEKIEQAVRCFIPELLKSGYTRDEIYHFTRKTFLTHLEDPMKTLDSFLDHYSRKPHDYTVYLGLSNILLEHKEILTKHLKLSYVNDSYSAKLKLGKGYFHAKIEHISGLDAGKASCTAYEEINYFSSYYCFFVDYNGPLIFNSTFVIDEKTKDERLVITNQTRFNFGKNTLDSNTGALTELCIVALASKAQCSVKFTDKIVRLHNRAISNNGLENGFLNLWSILEVICVKDPEKSKINQVLDISVPILQYDYLLSVFYDLYQNLNKILPEEKYNSIISSIGIGEKDTEKIACLVLLAEYEMLFDSLIDDLINYPVLRTRLLFYHDKCKKRSDLLSLSKKYGRRITWHIYRIYRARNLITHSGGKPMYLKDLGEHLHSYVDILAHEVILKLAVGNTCHLSNVLVDSELLIEASENYFNSSSSIDYDSIHKICSPHPLLWEKLNSPSIY